jgi:hypothetical protein
MELLYFVPFLILVFIAISMMVQGWMIVHESGGYRENPKFKWHPEMKGVRKGDKLMTVTFQDSEDDSTFIYSELYEKIQRQKMKELFEEPSTYEDDVEED